MVIRDDDRKPALLRISHLFYRRYSIVAGYDSINTIRYGGIYKSFIYSVSIMHSMWNVVIHHGAVISAASVQRRPCSPKTEKQYIIGGNSVHVVVRDYPYSPVIAELSLYYLTGFHHILHQCRIVHGIPVAIKVHSYGFLPGDSSVRDNPRHNRTHTEPLAYGIKVRSFARHSPLWLLHIFIYYILLLRCQCHLLFSVSFYPWDISASLLYPSTYFSRRIMVLPV